MFFAASKIFWSLIQPLNALCLLALCGWLLRVKNAKCGQKIMDTSLLLILFLGIVPVGPVLLTWLENRYETPTSLPKHIDGMIVLGGAFESYLSKKTGHIVANDQIDRVLCFVDLAKRHPESKLVFSGGAGDITAPESKESEDAARFFKLVGLQGRKILYEDKSRNSFENVLYSMDITAPKNDENWLVFTSAYHMPRAIGVFQKFGWSVTPYPCDRKTDGSYNQLTRLPNVTGNFYMLNLAFKEMIGSVVYYFTGKSAFIVPPSSTKEKE